MAFSFENLEVYKLSLDYVEAVESLVKNLKNRVSYSLLDQLQRAALSIPLNLAEGNGRWHRGEKRQFFFIARGSVFECVPIMQVLRRKDVISVDEYEKYYEYLTVLSKMITNLIKSVEKLNK